MAKMQNMPCSPNNFIIIRFMSFCVLFPCSLPNNMDMFELTLLVLALVFNCFDRFCFFITFRIFRLGSQRHNSLYILCYVFVEGNAWLVKSQFFAFDTRRSPNLIISEFLGRKKNYAAGTTTLISNAGILVKKES